MKSDTYFNLNKIVPNITEESACKIIENYYIRKFGSEEAAQKYFKEYKKNPVDEFLKELNPAILAKFIGPFLNITSTPITDIIDNVANLGSMSAVDAEELSKSLAFLQSIAPEMESILNLSESRMKVSIIPLLEKKLQLSLSKTRKELGYQDQRTFNKWLSVFFEDKYANRGGQNGKISLKEYIEIVSAFMLSYDEESFNFSNIEELQNRFKNERSILKKELKKFTNNNYALLRSLIEETEGIQLPEEEYRKVPYKIASYFKSEFKKILQ
ncbi:hypothetical protein [Polaribacter atrinae]|uniref:Uncharacterized protein n=1 Tax=Polaribacter atrinae TaxID=1333662 RepID=A0A176TDI0_9FLAO|nr:hypothetical protein [Polaribacter atrinae]OAD45904.1 hypothetical protein LPB303_06350 [Polaribacter atrinae]